MEREESCPSRWKAEWIDGLREQLTSPPVIKGNYFESIVIGENAKGEVDWMKKYPWIFFKKNGGKRADIKRIEEQAWRAKKMFDPKHPTFIGWEIISVQDKLKVNSTPVDEEGTLDIIATDGFENAIIDLKLTSDVTSTRTKWSWGNYKILDYFQQEHYQWLYENNVKDLPRMFMFVMDYSVRMGFKFFEVNVDDEDRDYYLYRKSKFKEAFRHYKTNGWSTFPSKKECEECPINANCKDVIF